MEKKHEKGHCRPLEILIPKLITYQILYSRGAPTCLPLLRRRLPNKSRILFIFIPLSFIFIHLSFIFLRIKSRKRLPLNSEVKVQAARTFVPDRRQSGNRLDGVDAAPSTSLHRDVDAAPTSTSLHRADTMKDAHDNLLYSDVATDGTVVELDNEDDDVDDDDEEDDDRSCQRRRRRDIRLSVDRVVENDDDNDDESSSRVNNAIYDLAARVTCSQSADSLLSDAVASSGRRNHSHQQQQQQHSELTSSSSQASCLSGPSGYPTAERRKALPRMGAKTLKLKSPSTCCISRGGGGGSSSTAPLLSVAKDAVASMPDPPLLSPTPTSAAEKMKESLTDSGCSIDDATPTSPLDTDVKTGGGFL